MAGFNYIGKALFTWEDKQEILDIAYWADTGTLRVWDGDNEIYLGSIQAHPAQHVKFLHLN